MTGLGAPLEAVLVAERGSARPGGLLAVRVPISLSPEAAFAGASARGETTWFWDSTQSDAVEREVFAGIGEVHRIEASGADRFARVKREAAEVLARTTTAPRSLAAARWVGSFTFAPERDPDVAWPSPGATFVLPRATVSQRPGEGSFLTVVARAAELERPDTLAGEIEASLQARPALPARLRAPRVVCDGAANFVRAVEEALVAIGRDDLIKVVLSRKASVEGAPPADVVLSRLGPATGAVRFAFGLDGATFLGASPELLAAVTKRNLSTEALAGTEPRGGADLAEVQRLLVRDKDRREHELVVSAIEAVLDELGAVGARGETRVRTLGTVHHLVTPFSAPLPSDTSLLDVVGRMHPTPALGGAPRGRALSFVAARERRGPYAAPVGWLDARGDGAFVVGIRSLLLVGGRATVYAGAGIVEGSVPALELAETRAKESGMLRALGVGSAPPSGRRREARA